MAASVQKGLILLQQKRYPMAEEELRKFLAEEPDSFTGHAYLALALSHLKKMKEAFREADQAISLKPDHAYPHFVKAILLGRNAKVKEALSSIQEAIRLDPDDPDYFEYLSQVHFALRQWQPALDAAERGLRLNAGHVACQNARTQALIKLNRHEEASQILGKTLSQAPDKADVHSQLGFLYLEKGKYDEAQKAFLEALRLDPTDKESREGLARALKAHYPFYSLLLKYFLWTEKLGPQVRTGLIFGGYALMRGLSTLEKTNSHLAPWIVPVLGLYLFFVLGTWISDHLFNMVLCLTPGGRMALGEEKVQKYKWFGGCLLLSLAFFVAAYFTEEVKLVFGGVLDLFLVIPLASVFQIAPGPYRNWMWAYTAFTAFCGGAALWIYIVFHPVPLSGLEDVSFFFIFTFMLGILFSRVPGRYLTRKAREG